MRHAVMDIMGDLALLAPPGGSGMPMGHVVAFNADHALMMDFVVRVAEAIGEGHADAFPFMMLPSEVRPRPRLLCGSDRVHGLACMYRDKPGQLTQMPAPHHSSPHSPYPAQQRQCAFQACPLLSVTATGFGRAYPRCAMLCLHCYASGS